MQHCDRPERVDRRAQVLPRARPAPRAAWGPRPRPSARVVAGARGQRASSQAQAAHGRSAPARLKRRDQSWRRPRRVLDRAQSRGRHAASVSPAAAGRRRGPRVPSGSRDLAPRPGRVLLPAARVAARGRHHRARPSAGLLARRRRDPPGPTPGGRTAARCSSGRALAVERSSSGDRRLPWRRGRGSASRGRAGSRGRSRSRWTRGSATRGAFRGSPRRSRAGTCPPATTRWCGTTASSQRWSASGSAISRRPRSRARCASPSPSSRVCRTARWRSRDGGAIW